MFLSTSSLLNTSFQACLGPSAVHVPINRLLQLKTALTHSLGRVCSSSAGSPNLYSWRNLADFVAMVETRRRLFPTKEHDVAGAA